MTNYVWAHERERFIAACNGETPVNATLEQAIIDVFEQHPQLVVRGIDQVAASYAAGKVQSGWAVLRAHVTRAAEPARAATASDTSDRTRKTAQAEQWLRTCGIHFDRESEVQDELFFSRGLLHAWADDPALRERMLTQWRELRPTGEQLEREADERAEHWKRTTGKLLEESRNARAVDTANANIARAMRDSGLSAWQTEEIILADDPVAAFEQLDEPEPALAGHPA